jgi:hypothetical protein
VALTADNVRVAVTGGIFVAPTGTALPTSAISALNGSFDELGYIGEDGITESQNADSADIKAWQNGDTVRKVQTSHDLTYQFTFIETTDAVLEQYYGPLTGGVVHVTGDQLGRQSWVIEIVDGDVDIRIVIPDGQITERGEITYASGEAIGYQVTLTAYPDNSGVKAYIYRDETAS